MLAELLSDGHEPGSEVVGEFFQCFTEEESCAMLLLLACQHTRNTTSTVSFSYYYLDVFFFFFIFETRIFANVSENGDQVKRRSLSVKIYFYT